VQIYLAFFFPPTSTVGILGYSFFFLIFSRVKKRKEKKRKKKKEKEIINKMLEW
jgi:hypothetical protein